MRARGKSSRRARVARPPHHRASADRPHFAARLRAAQERHRRSVGRECAATRRCRGPAPAGSARVRPRREIAGDEPGGKLRPDRSGIDERAPVRRKIEPRPPANARNRRGAPARDVRKSNDHDLALAIGASCEERSRCPSGKNTGPVLTSPSSPITIRCAECTRARSTRARVAFDRRRMRRALPSGENRGSTRARDPGREGLRAGELACERRRPAPGPPAPSDASIP